MEDTNSRADDPVPADLEGPMATGTGGLSDDRQGTASDGASASRGGVAKVDFAKVYGVDKAARAALNVGLPKIDLAKVYGVDKAARIALNMGPATATVRGPVRGLGDAATTLLETLGITAEVDGSVPILLPSDDDLAYDVISEADSDLAHAVDMAAGKVRTPFWNTRQIRNALAWMLVSVAIGLYVVGAVLPSPWGTILNTLLGLSGVSAIDAYRLTAPPKLDDEADGGINDQ